MKNFKLDNDVKVTTGFKVPEGYFDGVTQRLMQQLPQEQMEVIPLYKRMPAWLSAAAVFILLAGIAFFMQNTTQTTGLNNADIEEYLVYHTNVNSYDIMPHLDQDDIDELEESIAISDDAIEDYLLNENIYLSE